MHGRIALRGHNLDGDAQADLRVHGGADKAVYGYPSEHYGFWCEWLGVDALPWGAFGENLTTEGLREADVCIGDRFRVGSALLEVSQPRIPCSKLALRHARADLPNTFSRAAAPASTSGSSIRASSRPATRSNARRPIRASSRSPSCRASRARRAIPR